MLFRWLIICIALLTSISAHAESDFYRDSVWEMLKKTTFAARELNYKGIFVYQSGANMRSVQIRHLAKNGRELTRNVVLDGQPLEVLSEGGKVVIFNKKNDKVMVTKRQGKNLFPAMLPGNLDNLKASYTVKLGETELVAGRSARIIDLVPNDILRYSYRIWADQEFGLLLKMSLSDPQNKVLEQIGFTQLSMMNTKDVNWYEPRRKANEQYVVNKQPSVNHVSDWVVSNLPPGFHKVDQLQYQPSGKKHMVTQMIFSDGLASVSLFIEDIDKGSKASTGYKTVGSTNLCANVIDGHQVTVVGEVPHKTVRQIAKSVRLQRQTAAQQ